MSENLFFLLPPGEDTAGRQPSTSPKQSPQEPGHADTLILDFSAPKTWEINVCLGFWYLVHPAYVILL